MSTTDRRALLADTAIDLIATRGLRALTHRALDTALDLPPGSASYYFRTRAALLEAVTSRIIARSREDFAAARFSTEEGIDPETAARDIARWLDQLLTRRRNHLIARHALLLDLLDDQDARARLAGCFFSTERAAELLHALGSPDPHEDAADFVAVLEGALFDRFTGNRANLASGTVASVDQLTRLLSRCLPG